MRGSDLEDDRHLQQGGIITYQSLITCTWKQLSHLGKLEEAIKGRENIQFLPMSGRKSHELRGMQGKLDLMVKRTNREEVENTEFIDGDKPGVSEGTVQELSVDKMWKLSQSRGCTDPNQSRNPINAQGGWPASSD